MAKASNPRKTPMMIQYLEIKKDHPDVFLFYRMGDFYELFEEDAVEASRLLGITLTARSKGDDAIPMAGVPVHSVDDYLRKLVTAGHRVAICEQLEDPSQTKGLVKRGVVRVITPGTLTENFVSDDPIHLVATLSRRDLVYLAWCDLSTGEIGLSQTLEAGVGDLRVGLAIQETIHPEETAPPGDWPCALGRPGWEFQADEGRRLAEDLWGQGRTRRAGAHWGDGEWAVLGGLLHYLQETQKASLDHLRFPESGGPDEALRLDPVTVRSLDLIDNHRTGDRRHTLFEVLDRCRTAAGRRLLRRWITAPLVDPVAIRQRQLAFSDLADDPVTVEALRSILQDVLDIERLLTRLSLRRGGPRDLAALGHSLATLGRIREAWSSRWTAPFLDRLQEALEPLDALTGDLVEHLVDEPPLTLADGGVIREGLDATLDDLRAARSEAHGWLARYQAQEVEATGLTNLRVAHNRVFGYTIELPRRDADRVPDHFKRQQTLKNVERYVTAELKEFEAKLLTARDRSLAREREIYEGLVARILESLPVIQQRAEALALCDVITALSAVAAAGGWTLPEMSEGRELEIQSGRHPVVETTLDSGEFVPNDISLGEQQSLLLITGPNMAGKSTYIRQVALLVILAQMGVPVPAASMRWSPADRIHTRIGAADELARGQSTFMVEMAECAHILRSATSRSLLVFDEVGRGTSTLDGLAIARAIVEHLATRLTARTLFATHYHELTQLSTDYPRIVNANVLVREWGDDIVFLHQVVPGATDRSYGVHVAKLAGIPPEILERATTLMNDLRPEALFASSPAKGSEHQADLFGSEPSRLERRLRELDLDDITPRQALDLLDELRRDATS